jgi:hypothetical protein
MLAELSVVLAAVKAAFIWQHNTLVRFAELQIRAVFVPAGWLAAGFWCTLTNGF